MSSIRCQENKLTFVSYTKLSFVHNASLACMSCLSYMCCSTPPKRIIYGGKAEMQHADIKHRC